MRPASAKRKKAGALNAPPNVPGRGWPWTRAAEASAADGPWPRVTIVTPSFNQGRFLEETLRSVLLQGYPELEYIVIDGASTDGSVEILRHYAPWLSHWTSEPDGGQSEAINEGFARATGEIVTFLASDDVYEPGTLHDVARRFREHPECGAVVGAFRFLDEESRRAPEVHLPRLPGPGPHDLALLDPASWRLHQVSTFYARRALDAVGRRVREDLCYTMDRELLYRVCRRYPVALTERVYGAFRRHPESKSVASIVPMWREMADLHLLDAPADEAASVRRRRRALWRRRRARGYLKLAGAGVGWWAAAAALARAACYRPDLLGRRHYSVSWLGALGLLPLARRVRGAARRRILKPAKACGKILVGAGGATLRGLGLLATGRTADRYGIRAFYRPRNRYSHFDARRSSERPQDRVYFHLQEFFVARGLKSVLDVGCGTGFKLLKYFGDYQTLGLEKPPILDHLMAAYPDRNWRLADFDQPPSGAFDMVLAVDVIEHLADPDELMRFITRIDCRYVGLSTPDRSRLGLGSRLGPPDNRYHLREWSQDEFVRYAARFFLVLKSQVVSRHEHFVIGEKR